jgi:hypothetical protein
MRGNCFCYAVKRRLQDIWRVLWLGRIDCEITWVGIPKLRFWYVAPDGTSERFEPVKPKQGWLALFHCWFEGRVRKGKR